MVKMRHKFLLISAICFIAGVLNANADDVRFTASAPGAVVQGQQFRLSYTLTNADGSDLRIPELPDFDVLMGPSTSQSSRTQIINGTVSSERSIIFTYILVAKKEGTFDIPEATIKVKNGQYTSNTLKIKVLPPDANANANPGASSNQGNGGQASSPASAGKNISNEDIFVRANVAQRSVYENEGFLITFKLYTLYDVVSQESIKFPEFEGFIAQEIELPQNRQWALENYNGRNYRTIVLKQAVLFPQRSGEITIGTGKYDFVLRMRTQQQVRSIFDDFFDTYTNVTKPLVSPAVTINVKPLPPGKPASFSGAVGDYKMTSSISPATLKSDESVTVKVVISGSGNIKMVKNPEIVFPNDFEIYDPTVDVNTKINAGGVSGTKTIEYLAIPRYAGDFTIPSAEFSYFDVKSGTYKTLHTETFALHVDKGTGNAGASPQVFSSGANKEDLKLLGQDIRYIKTDGFHFNKKGDFFFGTWSYWLCYIIPAILFITFFIVYRKQAKENANIALVRTKKANKVATKRLKTANKYMRENKSEAFYDEVLKALWGYLSDKLSIPVSQLTKDNVESELSRFGAGEDLIKDFRTILDSCEFARFAPVQNESQMDIIYDFAVKAIDKMENTIKK